MGRHTLATARPVTVRKELAFPRRQRVMNRGPAPLRQPRVGESESPSVPQRLGHAGDIKERRY
jgi:hypothetical protein